MITLRVFFLFLFFSASNLFAAIENAKVILEKINELSNEKRYAEAAQQYKYFDCLLVNEHVIAHSNKIIEGLRSQGKEIIASTDPHREPKDNELVIVYGNYHHAHNNLPYLNKIWRHPLYYKDVVHTKVEYDPAWEPVGIIYVINLEERKDRYQETLSELCKMHVPLNRIYHYIAQRETVTGDKLIDLMLGCTKSHANIVEHYLKSPHQHAVIFEDDVTFTADIDGNLARLKLFFDRNYDYEICLLNASKYHEIREFDDLLLRSYQECTTGSAYLLSRKGAEQVLFYMKDGYEKMKQTMHTRYVCDRYWTQMQKNNKFFLFRTKFGYQRCNYSSITGKTECHFD